MSEKRWYERIYLQEDTDGETTWCQDQINDDDCEYIRADKYATLKLENLRLNRVDWETIVDAIDIDNPAVKQYAIRCWKRTAEEQEDG